MSENNNKSINADLIAKLLESIDWSINISPNRKLYIVKSNKNNKPFCIPACPETPNKIYLQDLVSNLPVLHQEFIDTAESNISFDIYLHKGDATSEDIEQMFLALHEAYNAFGGEMSVEKQMHLQDTNFEKYRISIAPVPCEAINV